MKMHIGDGNGRKFMLPEDATTETFGVLGKRGTGKTHTAMVLTECLLVAGSQVVVLDPLDVCWGLRSSADGKASGLAVYVFGGEHADLPLDGAAGKLVADVVVEQGISVVLSLRHLSKSAQRRFVADFAERLYERKGVAQYRTPLHLVIDEADAFAPQRAQGEDMRMLGAIDTIVRRGRSSGLGVTLISQRAAVLNKDVLTQIEVLIVHRTLSPQDRKALEAWIEAHDSEGHRAEFMASLASLEMGEAWIWSPSWLDSFERVRIRGRSTFDSSSTPKAGDKRIEPAQLAAVDIEGLRDRMAAVVKEAEANDPRKLRAQIADLQRQLAAKTPTVAAVKCDHERELAAMHDAITERDKIIEEQEKFRALYADAAATIEGVTEIATRWVAERDYEVLRKPSTPVVTRSAPKLPARNVATKPAPRTPSVNGHTPVGDLTTPQKRVIDAGASLHVFGVLEIAGPTLAAHAGYRYSGGFRNILSELRGLSLIDDVRPKVHRLTDAGMTLAEVEEIADAEELRERWLSLCSNPTRPLLMVLIAIYPEMIAGPDLAARCAREYSGGFRNLMSELCTMSAAERPTAGHLRASDHLFPEGAS